MNATAQAISNMTSRQKVMGLIFVVIVFGILWQAYAMFSRSNKSSETWADPTMKQMSAMKPMAPMTSSTPGMKSPASPPQPAFQPGPQQPQMPTADQSTMTQNESDLMRLQQETQAKYLSAVNELQMLKVAKDIAEANQAIMAARLNTVTAEKKIVDTLTPSAPQTGASQAATPGQSSNIFRPQTIYSAVSVTQLQHQWRAVLSSQGNLYNVSIGDVLPPDGSKVISINRTGVVLELNGERKKISLVPII